MELWVLNRLICWCNYTCTEPGVVVSCVLMSAEASLCCLVDFRGRGLSRDLREDVLLLHTTVCTSHYYWNHSTIDTHLLQSPLYINFLSMHACLTLLMVICTYMHDRSSSILINKSSSPLCPALMKDTDCIPIHTAITRALLILLKPTLQHLCYIHVYTILTHLNDYHTLFQHKKYS